MKSLIHRNFWTSQKSTCSKSKKIMSEKKLHKSKHHVGIKATRWKNSSRARKFCKNNLQESRTPSRRWRGSRACHPEEIDPPPKLQTVPPPLYLLQAPSSRRYLLEKCSNVTFFYQNFVFKVRGFDSVKPVADPASSFSNRSVAAPKQTPKKAVPPMPALKGLEPIQFAVANDLPLPSLPQEQPVASASSRAPVVLSFFIQQTVLCCI